MDNLNLKTVRMLKRLNKAYTQSKFAQLRADELKIIRTIKLVESTPIPPVVSGSCKSLAGTFIFLGMLATVLYLMAWIKIDPLALDLFFFLVPNFFGYVLNIIIVMSVIAVIVYLIINVLIKISKVCLK